MDVARLITLCEATI